MSEAFDPRSKMIRVQGNRQYLPATARISWFREDFPAGGIETEIVEINLEKQYAIFRATVRNEAGVIMGQGTKFENVKGFPDYIEKAEKGAVSRALGLCGYGTEDAIGLDGEENRPADAPVDMDRRPEPQRPQSPPPQRPAQAPQQASAPQNGAKVPCDDCGGLLMPKQAEAASTAFGAPLCSACIQKRKA